MVALEYALNAANSCTWWFCFGVVAWRLTRRVSRRPPRTVRWLYHHLVPVYPVTYVAWVVVRTINTGSLSPWEAVFIALAAFQWWMFRQLDDWDDEDRDAVRRTWERVVSRGHRLEVRPAEA